MPPRVNSRHTFTNAVSSAVKLETLELTERDPFRYRKLSDNIQHTVVGGDTLASLARRYFAGFARPDGLWWVIADFQPQPIIDPTLALEEGTIVVVPSTRTISEEIFSEKRRGA